MKHTPAEVQRMTPMMINILEDFLKDAAALHRAIIDDHPGYPTSTMGGGSGRGGDVSRPTERYALEGSTASYDLDWLYYHLHEARKALVEADRIRSRYMPAMSAVKRCGNPAGCPSKGLAEYGRAGLCQTCHKSGVRLGPDRGAAAA